MAIIDVPTCKTMLNITTTATDGWLAGLCAAVDTLIKNYCRRSFETQLYTEYPKVGNTPEMILRQRPVSLVPLTGTLTQGSPIVTGLSSTASLAAGLAVAINVSAVTQYLPGATVIVSVDSGTQVTLSNNASASGTVRVLFGPAVYADSGAYAGQGVNPYAAATQCLLGLDYMLDVDQPDGVTSRSGILKRLGGQTAPGGFWPWNWGWPYGGGPGPGRNSLTAHANPSWPDWFQSFKVVYNAGYGVGPAAMPQDLVYAAARLVAWLMRTSTVGGNLQSETLGKYQYTLMTPQQNQPPEVGEVKQILGSYRDLM
jgi:hypothetical protein